MIKKIYYIIAILIFSSFDAFAQNARETSFDERPICESQKGVWRQFGNGCAGSCRVKLDPFVMCTQALTNACDCGKARCWDNGACVMIVDFKKKYDEEKQKEQAILDKEKKNRKAAYKNYQDSVLSKLAKATSSNTNAANPSNPTPDPKPQEAKPQEPIIVTPQNQSQDTAADQANSPPMDFEVPPYFLQQQQQQESEATASQKKISNSQNKKGTKQPENMPGFPEIPMP